MGKTPQNIVGQIHERTSKRPIPYNHRRRIIEETKNCRYLTERAIDVPSTYNKIFASVWLNQDTVIVGTKCNKLLEINVQNGAKREVPLLRSPIPREVPHSSAGIHAVAVNPSKTFLATGGHNVNDLALYTLPNYDPYAVGEFHQGWLFGISWVNDFVLCTGAKDGIVSMWSILDVEGFSTFEPSCGIYRKTPLEIVSHSEIDRIRDIHYSPACKKLASIGYGKEKNDAVMSLIDINNVKSSLRLIRLPQKLENMAVSGHDSSPLFAVGSLSHLMIVDDRDPSTVDITSAKLLEPAHGVRSLSFQGDIITVGACKTSLMFYDVRKRAYITDHHSSPIRRQLKHGFVAETWDYHMHRTAFYPLSNSHVISIMTHCYDDSGLRLFAAGGPLTLELVGNYAAVWE